MMMNEQQYAVQTGGKEIRKDDVVKPKLKRRKSRGAMTWLLSRERSRVPAGSLCVSDMCLDSLSCISLHTHMCTVDMRDAVQAILRLLYMHRSMHQALHGSPVAI